MNAKRTAFHREAYRKELTAPRVRRIAADGVTALLKPDRPGRCTQAVPHARDRWGTWTTTGHPFVAGHYGEARLLYQREHPPPGYSAIEAQLQLLEAHMPPDPRAARPRRRARSAPRGRDGCEERAIEAENAAMRSALEGHYAAPHGGRPHSAVTYALAPAHDEGYTVRYVPGARAVAVGVEERVVEEYTHFDGWDDGYEAGMAAARKQAAISTERQRMTGTRVRASSEGRKRKDMHYQLEQNNHPTAPANVKWKTVPARHGRAWKGAFGPPPNYHLGPKAPLFPLSTHYGNQKIWGRRQPHSRQPTHGGGSGAPFKEG